MNLRFRPLLGAVLLATSACHLSALRAADTAKPAEAAAPQSAEEIQKALAELKKNSPVEKLGWQNGPGTGDLKGRAKMKFPAEFRFIGAKDAGKLIEMSGNLSSGNELGLLAHKADDWWVVFQFQDDGYVKDDEKGELDADKLLATFQRGAKQDNERRKEAGLPALNIVGWHTKPNYNEETKNLEWSIILESEGEQSINHNVRLLGRKGVTKVTLVLDDLKALDATLPQFQALLKDFSYSGGESYAEYKEGDKVAKYGLSALVLGGAAAGAYKLGLLGGLVAFFKKGWKLLVFAVVGLSAWVKNLVTGKRRPGAGNSP